ncbi:MAG: YcaQ family DNA glycosylase [Dehalococcoidia bacterium]|nr:YcaQ family DNA glycosylase [Dehalococcoidia bacterium]
MVTTNLGTLPGHTPRRALLAAQGLISKPRARDASADGIIAAIERMHALQIDTISVVARSPYLVLWSRVGDYEPAALDRLLAEHRIFEYWSHAACFLSMADFPWYRSIMLHGRRRHPGRERCAASHRELMDGVLARVRDEGPLRSADFAPAKPRKGAGWWDWKDEKIALELLFDRGDLVIARRDRFQRVYDLPARVMPGWSDAEAPPVEVARHELVLRAVKALGIARPEWVQRYLYATGMSVAATRVVMRELAAEDRLLTCAVDGWSQPGYVHPENGELVASAAERPRAGGRTVLLSPFDPVTWDRARALELFGFDYRIECYTPAPQRRYGYFTLPILHGERLIGRLDAKAHRGAGMFEVKALHLEPGLRVTAALAGGLREMLTRAAAWHGTPEVVVRQANVAGLAGALMAGA